MIKPETEPFNISTLLETESFDEAETYAPSRPRLGQSCLPRGDDNRVDSAGSTPGPQHDQPIGPTEDNINPSHYRRHPSGIECIEVTRHMNFNAGNAVKYIWRYMDKGDPVENLKKAQWYLDDEIRRLGGLR